MSGRRSTAVQPCSVCGRSVPRGRLMCQAHWAMVPRQLQLDVWGAWSRFLNPDSRAHPVQRLREYQRAADAATVYVTDQLRPQRVSTQPQPESAQRTTS